MTSSEAVHQGASRGRLATRVLLAVRVVVGIDFIVGGVVKLLGLQVMVDLFDRIGAGQWFRYLVGILELAGGIGVLIPVLSGLAAFGLAGLLISATFTNVAVIDDPPWVPLFWLVVVAVVAWDRWPTTKALFARSRRGRPGVR